MTVNIYDMAQTWNDGATTFAGIKLNVTNTASASGSLLMDLQVGGSSKFKVDKDGRIIAGAGSQASAAIKLGTLSFGPYVVNNGWTFVQSAAASSRLSNFGIKVNSSSTLGFGNCFADVFTTAIVEDAANTLALRNGANAQAFNIYNTHTDASNYERGFMRFVGNVLQIGTEKAGTGTDRNIDIYRGSTLSMRISSGQVNLYGISVFYGRIRGSGMSIEYPEVTGGATPETNYAKVYAEDNGAGKTRLMVQFQTGAAQQIAIEP